MSQHIECPCWQTGQYIWTNRCPEHVVKHPHHFSLSELETLAEWGKAAINDESYWRRLDRIRAQRD